MDRRDFLIGATVTVGGAVNETSATADCAKQFAALPALPAEHIGGMSAAALSRAYRSKLLSPVEVATALLDRIEASQPAINAFCFLDRNTTLFQAKASEERWHHGTPISPLDGVPVSLKAYFDFSGWPSTLGSKLDAPTIAKSDESIVARLRGAGMVFTGKTALPDHGLLPGSRSSLTGVTRNPRALDRTAGGSSSGAGAAAAAGLGPLHMGGDGGGSIRIPAAYCGVIGLKTSRGRLDVPESPQDMGVNGPLGRDILDIAMIMDVLDSRSGSRDAGRLPAPRQGYIEQLSKASLAPLTIGYCPFIGDGMKPNADVLAVIEEIVERLRRRGHMIEQIAPYFTEGLITDIARPYFRQLARELIDKYDVAELDVGLEPTLRNWIFTAGYMNSARIDPIAERAMGNFTKIAANEPCKRFDIVLSPAMPTVAHAVERSWPEEIAPPPGVGVALQHVAGLLQHNLFGNAAMVLPCGRDRQGLPIGLQVAAKTGEDRRVVHAGYAITQILLAAA